MSASLRLEHEEITELMNEKERHVKDRRYAVVRGLFISRCGLAIRPIVKHVISWAQLNRSSTVTGRQRDVRRRTFWTPFLHCDNSNICYCCWLLHMRRADAACAFTSWPPSWMHDVISKIHHEQLCQTPFRSYLKSRGLGLSCKFATECANERIFTIVNIIEDNGNEYGVFFSDSQCIYTV